MAIIDCVTFNGEYDLLEIRLNILNDYVDEFIIVEAPTTFSGKPKPLYYEQGKDRYKQWHDKIKYFVIDENYTPEDIALAENSPNVPKGGAENWRREFLQKESIKKALTHLDDDDTVFVGDCDEIWNPSALSFNPNWDSLFRRCTCCNKSTKNHVYKLPQIVYAYYLNNKSSEPWHGTICCRYATIKDSILNHIRTSGFIQKTEDIGWHFTSMGGYEEVKRKLSDSYTRESYWTNQVENNLKHNIENSKDFLGRGFTYKVDESKWPEYLKLNKSKYKHLLR